LLRVLFIRLGALSTDSSPARRRAWRRLMLCLVGDEQPDDGYLARLARQQTHEFACVVDSTCRNLCRSVRSGIAANCRLVIALGWMGAACMLNGRRCNCTHCRYTGPYYVPMIVPVMTLGAGPITVGTLGSAWLGLIISGGAVLYGGLLSGLGESSRSVRHDFEWLHFRFRMCGA